MPTRRTYYAILGISRRESPSGVRSAFRDLARRYHPDRAGPRGTAYFQEIVEAYQTLSDPVRRQDYDRGLQHQEEGPVPRPARVAVAPEPLIPEPLLPEPVSLMRDFEVGRPSVQEIHEHVRRGFTAERRSVSRQMRTLDVDVILRPDTALRGGLLTVGVPVFYPCPRCHGAGEVWGRPCPGCGASGLAQDEQPVYLQVPPGVRDGAVAQVPLRGLGIHNLQLRVRVRVTR